MSRPIKIREPIIPKNDVYSSGTIIECWDQSIWNCTKSLYPNFKYEVSCGNCKSLIELKKIDIDRHLKNKWLCKSCSRLGNGNPMYGLKNPCSIERIENIRKSRYDMWKRDGYNEKRLKSWKNTILKNHNWCVGKEKTKFEKYRREVYKYTIRNDLSKLSGYENRGKMKRGTNNTNLDHIYSIHNGYVNKIAPEIIGCIINLQFIHWEENNKKSSHSNITKEELYERYDTFIRVGEYKINPKK